MDETQNFLVALEGNQRRIATLLHQFLSDETDLTPKIRYKIPFYYHKSWICYINPVKNDRIELAFIRGNELSNTQGLLQPKGRKQVYGIEFGSTEDIPMPALQEVVQEAILLDQSVPYRSKRLGSNR